MPEKITCFSRKPNTKMLNYLFWLAVRQLWFDGRIFVDWVSWSSVIKKRNPPYPPIQNRCCTNALSTALKEPDLFNTLILRARSHSDDYHWDAGFKSQ